MIFLPKYLLALPTFLFLLVTNKLHLFQVLHPPDTDEWTLHIKRTRPGDAGWYECQVNSDPKITTPVLLVVRGEMFIAICLYIYFFLFEGDIFIDKKVVAGRTTDTLCIFR